MECGKVNQFRAACRIVRHKTVNKLEQELDEYTGEDGQIDMVNTNFINYNAKSPGIIAKLKTGSYQKSMPISYEVDIDNNSNILPFCIYETLFPMSTKKLLS